MMSGGYKDFCSCFYNRLICKKCMFAKNFVKLHSVHMLNWPYSYLLHDEMSCCHVGTKTFVSFFLYSCLSFSFTNPDISEHIFFLSLFFWHFAHKTQARTFLQSLLCFSFVLPFFTEKGKEDFSNEKLKFFGVPWV